MGVRRRVLSLGLLRVLSLGRGAGVRMKDFCGSVILRLL